MSIVSQKREQNRVLDNFMEDPQVVVRLTQTLTYMLINASVKQAGSDLAH